MIWLETLSGEHLMLIFCSYPDIYFYTVFKVFEVIFIWVEIMFYRLLSEHLLIPPQLSE